MYKEHRLFLRRQDRTYEEAVFVEADSRSGLQARGGYGLEVESETYLQAQPRQVHIVDT